MKASEISTESLKRLLEAGHNIEIACLAQAELDRRCKDCDNVHDGGCVNTSEAKEVKPATPLMPPIKAAPECDRCLKYGTKYCNYNRDECDNGTCWNLCEGAKPPAAPVAESWIDPAIIKDSEVRYCIIQLQRRLEAVERNV
jgi:hypothetical protein